jgi:hypothetical protein
MLMQKLNLKPGMRFIALNAPDHLQQVLGTRSDGVSKEKLRHGGLDLILLFVTDKKALMSQWQKALRAVKESGALWIAYPKKSSGVPSDLSAANSEWEVYKGSPWQPVSSISIDGTWSARRFMHRPGLAEQRGQGQEEVIRDVDGSICVDKKNRVVAPPTDLLQLLKKSPQAGMFLDSLSFTNKREYVEWIITAKRPETRAQRRAQTIEKLLMGKRNPSDK